MPIFMPRMLSSTFCLIPQLSCFASARDSYLGLA